MNLFTNIIIYNILLHDTESNNFLLVIRFLILWKYSWKTVCCYNERGYKYDSIIEQFKKRSWFLRSFKLNPFFSRFYWIVNPYQVDSISIDCKRRWAIKEAIKMVIGVWFRSACLRIVRCSVASVFYLFFERVFD